jgi:KaiC/GvpD/RAD55 family RecA-like ATPase
VNRFSGKAGSGDFLSIYKEVFGTEFIESNQIIADKVFKKDVALNDKELKLQVREDIKRTRKKRQEGGYEPLVWNTPGLTNSFPVIKAYSYVVIAGPTKSGKSTVAFDLAVKNAQLGKNIIYYTLEMTREQLIDNISRTAAKITPQEERVLLRTGKYPEDKEKPFRAKKESILALDTLICLGKEHADDTTIVSILDNVLEFPDTDLLVIDNLDKIDAVGRQDDITRQKYISNMLVYFTNEYHIPVILVHHLRKEGGEKDSKLFRGIDSLSGSSKISHDADMTLFVARERDMDGEYTDSDTWIRVMETREFSPVTKRITLINGTFEDPFSSEK